MQSRLHRSQKSKRWNRSTVDRRVRTRQLLAQVDYASNRLRRDNVGTWQGTKALLRDLVPCRRDVGNRHGPRPAAGAQSSSWPWLGPRPDKVLDHAWLAALLELGSRRPESGKARPESGQARPQSRAERPVRVRRADRPVRSSDRKGPPAEQSGKARPKSGEARLASGRARLQSGKARREGGKARPQSRAERPARRAERPVRRAERPVRRAEWPDGFPLPTSSEGEGGDVGSSSDRALVRLWARAIGRGRGRAE
jgi:hypothetical protein